MQANQDSEGNLRVTHFETFLVVIDVAIAVTGVFVWFQTMPAAQQVLVEAAILMFVVVITLNVERSTFVFDRTRRELRWERKKLLRQQSGEVPFSSITAISLERSLMSRYESADTRRLVVHTTTGPIRVTTAFSAGGESNERAGHAIQGFLAAASGAAVPFTG